ncbi:chitin binding peritrophin-a [Holotrichia oblita]|uniref:Chitin binding peritrophin-a n=1 Tax=Holotrichia oblita TaxID=644536 RepID=A0ACB9TL10_HOLOL|nr:chitin binding peritrophin-a [Holotrichia oblita]
MLFTLNFYYILLFTIFYRPRLVYYTMLLFLGSTPLGTCPSNNNAVVLLPDDENCQIFYQCDWGTPVLKYCTASLNFNAITYECDYPENVNCDRSGVVNPQPEGTGPLVECPTNSNYATYIPDKSDCTIYYVCNFGKPIQQKCPDGLYYDGTIWACTYENQAKCYTYVPIDEDTGVTEVEDNEEEEEEEVEVEGSGPIGTCPELTGDVDVLLPDGENCGIFYKCDNGIPVLMQCPDDLYFNTETDECDYPENVNCDRTGGGDVTPPTEEGGATGPVISCPSDGVYLPDKTDCTVYYVCSFGNAIPMKCPDGLYYDGTIWGCTYEYDAVCYTYEPKDSEETGPGQVPEGSGPIGTCPEITGEVDVLLPDGENCAIFYKCANGVPVAMDCPAGLNFNTKTDQCDYPENVNCDRTAGTDEEDNKEEESDETIVGSGPIGTCPEVTGDVDVLLPDGENCGIFYKCAHGVPVAMACPAGLYFNTNTDQCDYPENVNCDRTAGTDEEEDEIEEENSKETITGSGPIGTCPEVTGDVDVLLPDGENCGIFYKCANGVPVAMNCPAGLNFNTKTDQCDFPENVNCDRTAGTDEDKSQETINGSGPVGTCPEITGDVDVLLPDGENCAIFYKCDNGVPVVMDCPDDLYFNTETDECDHPENVNCDRTDVPSVDEQLWVGECPEYSTVDVYLPSKNDPHKFYVCVGTTPVEMECPAKLVFVLALQRCDYA